MVSAPGKEIRADDIPAEFGGSRTDSGSNDWTDALAQWAARQLDTDTSFPLLELAQPEFEKALINAALQKAHGRKQDAAKLLGWGRNTLSRKIKDLGLDT